MGSISVSEGNISLPGYIKNINITNYSYDLPDEKIAQYPVKERDRSRLLISEGGNIKETEFSRLADFIPSGHLMVFNNSRVVRARILFQKETGAMIEIFCLEPVEPADYERIFGSNIPVLWKCIVGNLKKWKGEILKKELHHNGKVYLLTAEKLKNNGDSCEVRFSWNNSSITFSEVLEEAGHIPLPPYINRTDNDEDIKRYQTVYATVRGSVAAPTAGLHFTEKVLSGLAGKNIVTCELTLHVGAGTFKPVKKQKILNHEMHGEHVIISRETIIKIRSMTDKIVAVGTTSARSLESLYWTGIKILQGKLNYPEDETLDQWEAYSLENSTCTARESIDAVLGYMQDNRMENIRIFTRLLIVPGYKFRLVNGLITNFHQPGSTLLLLVAAFCGEKWREIYNYALTNNFRFLSYGDSTLMFK